jgi:flagellar basal-body rod modification protein FlgD
VITSTSAIRTARDTAPPTGTQTTSGSSQADGSSNAITQAAGGDMGKDQFVKLLVTEMQNQDPLNPMDGKELAVQLAQFSSVEQLMNVNTKLDDLTAAVKAQQGSSATTSGTDSTAATSGAAG